MHCGIANGAGSVAVCVLTIFLPTIFLPTAVSAAASEGEAPPSALHLTYFGGVASDYVYRGVSQTNNHPSLFFGVSAGTGDFYAGIWTSNVDFAPFGDRRTSQEIDLSLGLMRRFIQTQLDVGVVFVEYVNNPGHTNYLEAYAKATRDIGRATLGVTLAISPAYPGQAGYSVYGEANAKYAFSPTWSISLALGSQAIERGTNYLTWNFGPTIAIAPNVSLDLRYSNTDQHAVAEIYGERVAAMLTITL